MFKKNYTTAATWYLKAAEQGHLVAQSRLGVIYGEGYGVPKNYEISIKWYTRAALQGDAEGQYNVGKGYYEGWLVEKNYVQAYVWYSLSAAQGNPKARLHMNLLEPRLSPEELAQAKDLATKFKPQKEPPK